MKDGFIKVAACTPEIQVADVDFNVDKIISQLEKCREEGVNESIIHVDFMIGSDSLDIDAKTKDGKTIPIFRNGDWAF